MQIKCTSCGAAQELEKNNKCGYCGSPIEQEKAQENFKSSFTGEVGNFMMMADTAIEASNWDEAMQFFNKALEKDTSNSDAWLGKGIAMVYTSKIGDIKTKEAITYWKNAIKFSTNDEAMSKRVAKEINIVVNAFYPSIEKHYIEFSGLDDSYKDLVSRFATLESALDYASQLDNVNIIYPQTGVALCKRVINLPRKYAQAAQSAALIEGAVGQLSSNKYSRQRATKEAFSKVANANSRKKEIEQFSSIVEKILNKYSDLIKTIDPTLVVTNFKEDFIIETFKSKKQLEPTYLAYHREYGSGISRKDDEVNKVLLEHGLVNQSDIDKNTKKQKVLGLIVVIALVIAGILGFVIK